MPQADWLEVVVIWAPFERQTIEVQIFERANFSGFDTWKFNGKEYLNPRKQIFVLNLRLLPSQKSKVWSIFDGKKSLYRKIL